MSAPVRRRFGRLREAARRRRWRRRPGGWSAGALAAGHLRPLPPVAVRELEVEIVVIVVVEVVRVGGLDPARRLASGRDQITLRPGGEHGRPDVLAGVEVALVVGAG